MKTILLTIKILLKNILQDILTACLISLPLVIIALGAGLIFGCSLTDTITCLAAVFAVWTMVSFIVSYIKDAYQEADDEITIQKIFDTNALNELKEKWRNTKND